MTEARNRGEIREQKYNSEKQNELSFVSGIRESIELYGEEKNQKQRISLHQ